MCVCVCVCVFQVVVVVDREHDKDSRVAVISGTGSRVPGHRGGAEFKVNRHGVGERGGARRLGFRGNGVGWVGYRV